MKFAKRLLSNLADIGHRILYVIFVAGLIIEALKRLVAMMS